MGRKKSKKSKGGGATNKSKRQLVLELENASSESDDEDTVMFSTKKNAQRKHSESSKEKEEQEQELSDMDSADGTGSRSEEQGKPRNFNEVNHQMLRKETTVEDLGQAWHYPILCCCKIRVANPVHAFFCQCCMYGRAINVALEFPYLVNCLCCYVCQPCRRKEIRTKYNINGSCCGDCAACLFCPCLVGPQIIGEVMEHEECAISMCGTLNSQLER